MARRRRLRLARDEERLCDQRPDDAGLARARDGEPLQRGVVADVIRGVAVRDLPQDLALVQADCADAPVRRLRDRQALNRESGAATFAAARATRPCGRRRRIRRWRRNDGRRSSWGRTHGVRVASAGERAAQDVVHVVLRRIRLDEAERAWRLPRIDVHDVRLGIVGPARPHGPSTIDRQRQRAERAADPADDGRREDRSDLVSRDHLLALGAKLGGEVDQVVARETIAVVLEQLPVRVERERLRRRIPFTGHVALFDRPLLDRPDRLPGHAIEHVEKRLLGRLRERLDRPAVDRDVRENRRARDVEVPDPVVHELIVPLALTGLQIDRDDALAEQVAARSMTAIVVARRLLDRQIGHPQFFIDRDLTPDTCVAGVRRRVLLPRVAAELTRLRNRVEDPQPLPCPDVEPADVTLVVDLAARHAAGHVRGADDHRVSCDDRRGVQANLAFDGVDDLIVVLLQIDNAILAEARDRNAGLCIERDEPVAGRDVENPFLTAIGPVREAASRELARRLRTALPFALAMHPHLLARRRIESDDGPAGAGGREEDATRHQRRSLEIELGSRAQVLGLEPPGNLQLAEIVGTDLIQRRVPRVGEIGAIRRPLAVFRARLAGDRQRCPDEQTHERSDAQPPSTH